MSFSTDALSQDYLVHTYDENNGLMSSTVYDVGQDALGRMWFATRSGISVYDGLHWMSYSEVDGLPAPGYSKLRVDEDGTVWVLSVPAWFSVLYFENSKWVLLPQPHNVNPSIGYASFEVFSVGRQKIVAVGTNNSGVYLFTNGTWRQVTPKEGLLGWRINGIVIHKEKLYVATDDGLSIIDGSEVDNSLNDILNLPTPEIVGIELEEAETPEQQTKIWLKGKNWLGYMEDETFKLLSTEANIPLDGLYHNVVMQPDNSNGVFFGNPYDLCYCDTQTNTVIHIGQGNGLISEGTTSIFVDRERNVWITSLRGASKIASRRFASYRKEHGLLDNEVTAIVEQEPGTLVFGHNDGLTICIGDEFRTLSFTRKQYVSHAESRVLDLRVDSESNIWVAASHLGLARMNRRGQIQWYGENHGLTGTVSSVLPETSGTLWVATSEGLFKREGETFVPVETGDLSKTYLRRIVADSDGSIYAGTPRQGVRVYKNGKWRSVLHPSERTVNDVYSVYVDTQERVWVGSLVGLYILQNDSLVKFREDDFQIDRPVYLFVEDNKGQLWFGTDNGVIRWDGKHAREYTISQGFAGRETNRAAGIVDRRGQLWIGTDMGVSCYREQFDMDYDSIPPPLVELLSIEVAGNKFSPNVPIELGHDDNDLNFHFRAISFIDESLIQYKGRLGGFDKDWSSEFQSLNRQLRYTNLAPGSYRFHLKAKNAMGVWSLGSSTARITVQRPYWMQWWFYLLVVGLIGLTFYGATRYVSERRYATRLKKEVRERTDQLRESEEKYRLLVASATDAIAAFDKNGRFLVVNEAAARIMGGEPDDLINRTLADVFPEKDAEERMKNAQQIFQSGQGFDVEICIPVHGTSRWFRHSNQPIRDESGEITSILSISTDITDQKNADKALRESEELYRTLIETSPDAVTVTDLKGNITYASKRTCELHGYTTFKELLGKSALELIAPEEHVKAMNNLQRTLEEGAIRNIEYTMLRADGSRFIGELNATLIRDASGEPKAFVATIRDVTEREQLRTQLLQSEKMSSLGQLISGIAHELNNPLTGVLGFSQLLLTSPQLPENMTSSVETINREAERARKIIQNLLTFARQRKPEKRNIQINEVINRILDLRSYEMRVNNIEVIKNFTPKLPPLLADEYQLQQVFMNLIINAEQAMLEVHEKGCLKVTTKLDADRNIILISFQDDGPGIAKGDIPNIFNPFFTTKPVGKGTGLGLSISYSIIQEHVGFISVDSTKGRGSTFTVELPIVDLEKQEAELKSSPTVKTEETTVKSVLVVDDEISVLELIKEALEHEGYTVETATRGEEAIRKIEERQIQAIISDLKMPGESGEDIYLYCKEKRPDLVKRFLLLTGDVVGQDAFRFIEEHNVQSISKPFDLKEFISSIHRLLKKES